MPALCGVQHRTRSLLTMRSLLGVKELPSDCCAAQEEIEPALPTAGCSRAGATVPRRRAPQLSSGGFPQDLRLPRRERLAGQP